MVEQEMTFNPRAVFGASCVGMMLFGISMIVMGAVLPVLQERLGLSVLEATGVVAWLPVGLLAGSAVFGPVCDSYGHRGIFFVACGCVVCGAGLLSWAWAVPVAAVSTLAVGFGGGILNGQTNALVADISEERSRGARLSLLGSFYGIGAIAIPLFMGVLHSVTQPVWAVRIIVAGMAVMVVACTGVRFPRPASKQGFSTRRAVRLLIDPVLVLLSVVLFLESGIEGATNNWVTTYLAHTTDHGLELLVQALTVMLVSLTLSRLILTVVLRVMRREWVLAGCFVLAVAGFVLLGRATYWLPAFAGMALVGAGVSATFPVILDIIGARYATMVGTAFGIAMTVALVGNLCVNSLTGVLMHNNPGVFPWLMAGCVVLMAVLVAVVNLIGKNR